MPAPAVYILAVIGTVAAGFVFKEFVYEPHIAPKVQEWWLSFHARRRRRQMEGPISIMTERQSDDADDAGGVELERWRSDVSRSGTLRLRKNRASPLDETNASLPYIPLSPTTNPTHVVFDSETSSVPSTVGSRATSPSIQVSSRLSPSPPPSARFPRSPTAPSIASADDPFRNPFPDSGLVHSSNTQSVTQDVRSIASPAHAEGTATLPSFFSLNAPPIVTSSIQAPSPSTPSSAPSFLVQSPASSSPTASFLTQTSSFQTAFPSFNNGTSTRSQTASPSSSLYNPHNMSSIQSLSVTHPVDSLYNLELVSPPDSPFSNLSSLPPSEYMSFGQVASRTVSEADTGSADESDFDRLSSMDSGSEASWVSAGARSRSR